MPWVSHPLLGSWLRHSLTEDRLTKEKPMYLLAFLHRRSLPRETEDLNLCICVGEAEFACWGTCNWRSEGSLKCVGSCKLQNFFETGSLLGQELINCGPRNLPALVLPVLGLLQTYRFMPAF